MSWTGIRIVSVDDFQQLILSHCQHHTCRFYPVPIEELLSTVRRR